MPLTSKEKEIKAIVESIRELDADDFQTVIAGMFTQALGTHEQSNDIAWKKVANALAEAGVWVGRRQSN